MRFETVHRGTLLNARRWIAVWSTIFVIAFAVIAILPGYWRRLSFAVGCYGAIAALFVLLVNEGLPAPIRKPLVWIFGCRIGLLVFILGVLLSSIIIYRLQETPPPPPINGWIPIPGEIGFGSWTTLKGKLDVCYEKDSGWLDLLQPISFQRGDQLKLTLGGTVKKILVQLSPKGTISQKKQEPDEPVGIIGSFDVVESDTGTKIVKLILDADHPSIVRISVHGGSNPYGLLPFSDAQNGRITLLNAKRLSANIPEKAPTSHPPPPIREERDLGLVIFYPKDQRSQQMAQKLREIIPNTVRGWNINVYTVEKNLPVGTVEGTGRSMEFHYRTGVKDVATEIWERISSDYKITRSEDASIATHFEIEIDVIAAE